MPKPRDLTGQIFGRLTVLKRVPCQVKSVVWECLCSCGSKKNVRSGDIVSGRTVSCGCRGREVAAENGRLNVGKKQDRHGHARRNTSTYGIWRGMKQRCLNKNSGEYVNYGGRGISVCDRWLVFDNFLADMGERPEGHHIDRINNDGNYEPANCRWVTPKQNQRHTRKSRMVEAFGEVRCLAEWAELKGIRALTIHKRLRRGMDAEQALATPVEKRCYENRRNISAAC